MSRYSETVNRAREVVTKSGPAYERCAVVTWWQSLRLAHLPGGRNRYAASGEKDHLLSGLLHGSTKADVTTSAVRFRGVTHISNCPERIGGAQGAFVDEVHIE